MPGRMSGKVALVTGGGGGIGAATVRLFHEEGGRMLVVDRDEAAARAVAAELDPRGHDVLAAGADLAQEHEARRVVDLALERLGKLDALANVAGIRAYGPVTEMTPADWQSILETNLLAAAYCSKFAALAMARAGTGGSIIQVSSANALVGRQGMGPYDASKAAMLSLARTLACELAEANIRVNAVCPGATLTQFHVRRRAARTGESLAEAEAALKAAGAENLLKRQADPREIAYAILFLACDESSFVTGTTLMVDGGLSV